MKRMVCLAAIGEVPPSKTYTLLISVHNDADNDWYNTAEAFQLC